MHQICGRGGEWFWVAAAARVADGVIELRFGDDKDLIVTGCGPVCLLLWSVTTILSGAIFIVAPQVLLKQLQKISSHLRV